MPSRNGPRPHRIGFAAAIGILMPFGEAAGQVFQSTAIYSDLCFDDDSGKMLGSRVVLLRFPEGSYVIFQRAEGEIGTPQLSSVRIAGNSVEFSVDASGERHTFQGTLSASELVGFFVPNLDTRSGEPTFRLPAVQQEGGLYPICEPGTDPQAPGGDPSAD